MKLIGPRSLGILNLGAAACAATAATDIVTTGGCGLALLAASGGLAHAVKNEHAAAFHTHITKAQKAMEEEIAKNAFITGQASQKDIDNTYAELNAAISLLNLTPKDFTDWAFNPNAVATGIVSRLNNVDVSRVFSQNEASRKIAHILIFAAFTALKQDEKFWRSSEIYVAEKVLQSLQGLKADIAELKEDTKEADATTHAMLKALLAPQGINPETLTPQDTLNFESAVQHIMNSKDARKEPAQAAISDRRPLDAIDHLLKVGHQEGAAADDLRASSAETFRQAAELAYPLDTSRAINAYDNLLKYDGTDVWDRIYLSRLHVRAGNLPAAKTVLTRVDIDALLLRDQSVVLNELGDIAADQGDLPGARQAYEDGHAIAERLAASDVSNTGFQRDLSVSHNKIGDVAVAQGDLPGARQAYEDGLEIAERLAAMDAGHAEWQRDVCVSHWKLAILFGPDSEHHWRAAYEVLNAMDEAGTMLVADQEFLDMSAAKVAEYDDNAPNSPK